jgi:hypothetical protein
VSDAPQNALNYVMTQVSNQYYEVLLTFNATGVSPGIYHSTITATDNGTPVGVTTKQFIFEVKYDSSADLVELDESSFLAYPNPANDLVTLIFNNSSAQNEVQVFDLYGKLLISQSVKNTEQLDLRSLNKGLYIINLLENNIKIGTQRLIKN